MGWSIASIQSFSFKELRLLPGIYDFQLVGNLAAPALALAFVSILEATSIGKTLASRAGQRFDVNQEMYAMGLANTASAICGGMNAPGSLTRSMLSDTSGARSPLANVYSGRSAIHDRPADSVYPQGRFGRARHGDRHVTL